MMETGSKSTHLRSYKLEFLLKMSENNKVSKVLLFALSVSGPWRNFTAFTDFLLSLPRMSFVIDVWVDIAHRSIFSVFVQHQ